MERWIGRVALVTGASSGIGAELSARLVRHGMKVVGCGRNVEKIKDLASDLKDAQGSLLPIKCDMKKEEDILAMFAEIKKQFGGVDVCVNNAGVAHKAPLLSGETDKWRDMLDVNVLALCICTREAVQSMKERGIDDGHIIHISSMAGHFVPPGYDATFYCASKYAVRALTEGLRNELCEQKSSIRISSLSPGLVKTEFSPRMRGDAGRKLYEEMPHLTSSDVVDAVIYALSAPSHVQVHDILMTACKKPNAVRELTQEMAHIGEWPRKSHLGTCDIHN